MFVYLFRIVCGRAARSPAIYTSPAIIYMYIIAGDRAARLQTILGGVFSGTFLVYSAGFAKSIHFLGMLLFFQLLCAVCGREGPSVECKVQLHHQRLSRLLMLHFPRQAEKSVNIKKEVVEKER